VLKTFIVNDVIPASSAIRDSVTKLSSLIDQLTGVVGAIAAGIDTIVRAFRNIEPAANHRRGTAGPTVDSRGDQPIITIIASIIAIVEFLDRLGREHAETSRLPLNGCSKLQGCLPQAVVGNIAVIVVRDWSGVLVGSGRQGCRRVPLWGGGKGPLAVAINLIAGTLGRFIAFGASSAEPAMLDRLAAGIMVGELIAQSSGGQSSSQRAAVAAA